MCSSGWSSAARSGGPIPGRGSPMSTVLPSFRDRQRTLKNTYREDSAQAAQVTTVHSVTPAGSEPGKVRIAIDSPAGVELDVGAHLSVGGDELTACSGDMFLASLAACYEITLRLVASASKITINRLE